MHIHHAYLSFVSVHQMAPPLTEVGDIQLQLTTHLSTRRDERLSWPGWLTNSGRFADISGHPSDTGLAQDWESSPAKDWPSTAVPRNQLYSILWTLPILQDFFDAACAVVINLVRPSRDHDTERSPAIVYNTSRRAVFVCDSWRFCRFSATHARVQQHRGKLNDVRADGLRWRRADVLLMRCSVVVPTTCCRQDLSSKRAFTWRVCAQTGGGEIPVDGAARRFITAIIERRRESSSWIAAVAVADPGCCCCC